jgi:hypothetical protein
MTKPNRVAQLMVAAIDVGSPKNIGWWAAIGNTVTSGRDLDGLAAAVATALNSAVSVALGFEAPLYVPLPTDATDLNRQRIGERGRPWCAGAGTGALAMGAQQSAYLLAAISALLHERHHVSFDPADLDSPGTLVIWEAFVSARAKNRSAADPHVDDARVAVAEFHARWSSGRVGSDIEDQGVLNLVAASVLAAGLSEDLALLQRPCVVVRAPDLSAPPVHV